ncbi:MAG: MlaD family protein [Bacteroidia bacterium]
MNFSKELKTGVLIVCTIALGIYGLNYLKGYDMFSTSDEYYAIYPDANGLLESNPILINGMRVGKIQRINFADDNSGRVIVKFVLTNTEFKIPNDSKALVASLDLLGAKGIRIMPGTSATYLQDGDTLVTGTEDGMVDKLSKELIPTKQKAENLIQSIDSTLQQLNKVLSGGGSASLQQILANLSKTTSSVNDLLASEKTRLDHIFANAESITLNLRNNQDNLTAIMKNAALMTDSLAKSNLKSTIANADKSLAELTKTLNQINSGKGTIGKLLKDDSLYNHLDASAKDLDKLFIDMKEHPSRYVHFSVFGGKKDSK